MRFGSFKTVFTVALFLPVAVKAQFVSPYEISLDPLISNWTTDFAQRALDIQNDATPTPTTPATLTSTGSWTDLDSSPNPYGPKLPQLYSIASSADNPNTALSDALTSDRGYAYYGVQLNSTPPSGVNPTTYDQERLLYAAEQLIGTHYQHNHLPQFDPRQSVANGTFSWVIPTIDKGPVSVNPYARTTVDYNNGTPGTAINPYYSPPDPSNPTNYGPPYNTSRSNYGQPLPGMDCTDFTAYIYNEALGIQLHSGTPTQVKFADGTNTPQVGVMPTSIILSSTGAAITPTFILGPHYGSTTPNGAGDVAAMTAVMAQLRPGDLLYMQSGSGGISHVVVWLGDYGTNADGTPSDIPLVISSHDNTPAIFATPDSNIDPTTGLPYMDTVTGQTFDPSNPADVADMLPPPGVQILPFEPGNWFYQNFSFAMQILPVPEPSQYGFLLVLASACGLALRRFYRASRSS
jgi:cell wall-associated NlpC family hydrolase